LEADDANGFLVRLAHPPGRRFLDLVHALEQLHVGGGQFAPALLIHVEGVARQMVVASIKEYPGLDGVGEVGAEDA
jgi:hypothetical protein